MMGKFEITSLELKFTKNCTCSPVATKVHEADFVLGALLFIPLLDPEFSICLED